jgi:hypothetical protein
MNYRSLPTTIGRAKLENAALLGQRVNITKIEFGDGNGAEYEPTGLETALRRKVYECPPSRIEQAGEAETWIEIQAVIPHDVGGWYVREYVARDEAGDAIFIGNLPESFKPLGSAGAIKDIAFELLFDIQNADVVTLKVDPSQTMATMKWVTDQLNRQDGKPSALYTTTGAIALSGLGVRAGGDWPIALPPGARVLVKDQGAGQDNGLYIAAAGPWGRAADADESLEVTPGLFVIVEQGTVNADSLWQLVTDAPIAVGVTPLSFEFVAGRTGVAAGQYFRVTVNARGVITGGTNPTTLAGFGITDAAPLNSAPLTGTPTAPTAAAGTNTTQLATTAFVAAVKTQLDAADALRAPLASPALTGTPTAPTAAAGTNTTQLATTAFVAAVKTQLDAADALRAPLASPALTGTPTAPTAAAGTNTTQLATTGFVRAAIAAISTATERLRGLLRVGTQAEVDAGALNDVAVTPKKLFNGALIVSSTYMALKLPSWLGGWILQRGTVTVSGEAGAGCSVSITLPLAYTSAYSVVSTFCYTGARIDNGNVAQPRDKTLNGFTLDNQCMAGANLAGTIDFITLGR